MIFTRSCAPQWLRWIELRDWAVALASLLTLASIASPAAARENFLILVIDDVGVDKINVYSRDDLYGHPGEGANPGPTPNIDQLAAEGILFRNAYANPKCSPTRAQTLTGRHGFRTGIGNTGGVDLPLSETTIPEMLGAGWQNAALGKWHLAPAADVDHPNQSGFDHYAGHIANMSTGNGDYFSYSKVEDGVTTRNWSVYATTDEVDEAIDAISSAGENQWFVWVAFHAPHAPFHNPPSGLHTYNLSGNPGNPTRYAAALEAADTEIGRLLAAIPASVLADTTIIVFGDNGTAAQAVVAPFISGRAKGTVYEGGINVPFIVKSPHIAPGVQGQESLALIDTIDIFATLADIGGVSASAEDSLSILPYLQDPSAVTQSRRPFIYAELFSPNGSGPYTSNERAVRDAQYKLIWRDGADQEFYDLLADPWEQLNLLPASGLSAEQAAAYDSLATAILDPSVLPSSPGAVCGNGDLETGEACDDGGTLDGDCCDSVCQLELAGSLCNDADACTTGDSCDGAGVCNGGAPLACNDANDCTDDACSSATGCVYTANVAPCDDGDACTTADVCAAGSCGGGAPRICSDANDCTDDACSSATGCVFTANVAPCDDGDACTLVDQCNAGVCQTAGTLYCDDLDDCTADSCDGLTGCAHSPIDGCSGPLALIDGDIVMGDESLGLLFAVDPSTGDRSILSSSNVGLGPIPTYFSSLAWAANWGIYLVDGSDLFEIDPSSGDRIVISAAGFGLGPDLMAPVDVAFDWISDSPIVADQGLEALLRIDPVTGDRSVLSGCADAACAGQVGEGDPFVAPPIALAFEPSGDLIVAVWSDAPNPIAAIQHVDHVTGDRSVLSDCADSGCTSVIGSGPRVGTPSDLAVAQNGDIYVSDLEHNSVMHIDPVTGNRSLLAGSGPVIEEPGPIKIDQDGALLLVDGPQRVLFRIDLASGQRSIVSSDATGSGTSFAGPRGISLVPEPDVGWMILAGVVWMAVLCDLGRKGEASRAGGCQEPVRS